MSQEYATLTPSEHPSRSTPQPHRTDEEILPLDDLFDLEETPFGSQNTVHDRSQFQSKLDYDLHFDHGVQKKHYEVDFFLFIPNTMGIHSKTYTPEQFFGDLTNYLRIRTPEESAQVCMDEQGVTIPVMEDYLRLECTVQQRLALQEKVIQDVRLFGCLINTRFKLLQSRLQRTLQERQGVLPRPLQKKLRPRLQRFEMILESYRQRYIKRILRLSVLVAPEIQQAYLLINEYLSYQWESLLIRCSDLLPQQSHSLRALRQWLQDALQSEIAYRQEEIVPAITLQQRKQAGLEVIAYRFSLLKKFVYGVLYLQSKSVKKDKTYRNMIAAVGAALAASWAAVANFQQIQMINRGEAGFRIFLIFGFGVLAYVMKDRIKDLSKEYFNEKFKHLLPDQDVLLRYHFLSDKGKKEEREIGRSIQIMRYTKQENLPEQINYIRNEGKRFDLSPRTAETILHFHKKSSFAQQDLATSLGEIRHIKDIVRFDLNSFVRKLSDPNKSLRFYDPAQGIQHREVPKVYHLNIVFRYTLTEEREEGEEPFQRVEYERVRVVLNKEGIVRIEDVLQRGELSEENEAQRQRRLQPEEMTKPLTKEEAAILPLMGEQMIEAP